MEIAATPGIFLANSGVLPAYSTVLPYTNYVKWYEDVHIPDWMGAKEGAITSAWRYQSADPASAWPFLVAYKYPDISATRAPEFGRVTLNHPSLPEGGPASKFIQITVSSGAHNETWRSGSTGDDRGPLLVTETIELASSSAATSFHNWYTSTYITELSMIDGWRRTSRFSIGTNKWLALHEFEQRAFEAETTKVSGLLGKSQETKDVEKAAKKVDLALWKLVRVYGDKNAAWGLPGTDGIL
ncbi:hypothetical protein B0T16DRAFT_127457 [Cercophora newfieldiana]|uniref:Uncharacterized protein n=1 Tax=Cercophora newfieldiana TaxID=92897 RepID=A0AA40CSP5_9PEZI|nr:hypothetical protein B0T16DRAFT_127457 [Cercophora newfieldiana]